jgi:hypothetical protein
LPRNPATLPENSVVICIDGSLRSKALERAQRYLKPPDGRALSRQSHDYKRNGTSTLLAAFEVATDKVVAQQGKPGDGTRYLFRAAWPAA